MQTSTKITDESDFLTSQFVNPSGICINAECMLTAGIFFYQSQPGSWAKLTDPAFIPALPGPRNILGTAGLRETVPQLPVPSIKPFIPFLFFL